MATVTDMRIGDAAAALGIEAHVLRHWASVGLLAPNRSPSGHRNYDANTLDQARLIRTLQRAGLSLEQIRQLAVGARAERVTLIDAERAAVRERIALLRATDRFLEHLGECRHRVVSECPECSRFTARERQRTPRFSRHVPGRG
ncbi:MerR family transcriptional regulator [Nocardia sp. NPDC050406]|uniref:MerR family transcriptional regulator n=1 Tax=Nocardia sp. NPDC050406 TaxID=3364318 RepID=UPI0037B4BF67